MTCPVCNSDTQVTYTYDKDDHVVRDRRCRCCGYRFQTIEADEDMYSRFQKKQDSEERLKIKKAIRSFKEILAELEGSYD